MTKFRVFFLASICVLFAGHAAVAQVGAYALFTGAKINQDNTPYMYGPTVGVYLNQQYSPLVSAGVDFRGTFVSRGPVNGVVNTDQRVNNVLGGVRLAITPKVLPIKPYVEGLVGIGYIKAGLPPNRTTSTHFEYQALGGLDYTILPQLDWRVIEFSWGRLSGLGDSLSPRQLSTGVVFRLP